MFKSVIEAFEWTVSFTNFEKKPDLSKRGYRLDKMVKLLDIFGNPQNSYNTIHVAGSKGKGSTCAIIGSLLTSAGYKTGIYSSPHLLDYRERITNNHKFFDSNSYTEVFWDIKCRIGEIDFSTFPGGEPTTFELMTLGALLIFQKEGCQWAVIETGIGGRLDSTNVIIPKASVITPIELEHTDILGNTLEEIATEKAGIIKKGVPLFTSSINEVVKSTLLKKAKDLDSKVTFLPNNFSYDISVNGTELIYNNKKYKLGLEGGVQAINSVISILTVKSVIPGISEEMIEDGLKKTTLPGRFQIVRKEQPVVLDGAHTVNSVEESVKTFKRIFGDGVVIFGVIKGKNISGMAKIIADNFENIIISTPGSFKESDIDSVEMGFKEIKKGVVKIQNPLEAYNFAKTFNKPILVTGSFYMAGEIAQLVRK